MCLENNQNVTLASGTKTELLIFKQMHDNTFLRLFVHCFSKTRFTYLSYALRQ